MSSQFFSVLFIIILWCCQLPIICSNCVYRDHHHHQSSRRLYTYNYIDALTVASRLLHCHPCLLCAWVRYLGFPWRKCSIIALAQGRSADPTNRLVVVVVLEDRCRDPPSSSYCYYENLFAFISLTNVDSVKTKKWNSYMYMRYETLGYLPNTSGCVYRISV